MFVVPLADDFDPAAHGWEPHGSALDPAWHRIWLRWSIPWRFPASLSRSEVGEHILWAFLPTGADDRAVIPKEEVMAQIY